MKICICILRDMEVYIFCKCAIKSSRVFANAMSLDCQWPLSRKRFFPTSRNSWKEWSISRVVEAEKFLRTRVAELQSVD